MSSFRFTRDAETQQKRLENTQKERSLSEASHYDAMLQVIEAALEEDANEN